MKMRVRIYYAHPISTYGSEQEKADIKDIQAMSDETTEIVVVNPSSPSVQEAFEYWKKNTKKKDDHDMRFFKLEVAKCDGLIFRGDTSGVKYEVAKAKELDLPIMEL